MSIRKHFKGFPLSRWTWIWMTSIQAGNLAMAIASDSSPWIIGLSIFGTTLSVVMLVDRWLERSYFMAWYSRHPLEVVKKAGEAT